MLIDNVKSIVEDKIDFVIMGLQNKLGCLLRINSGSVIMGIEFHALRTIAKYRLLKISGLPLDIEIRQKNLQFYWKLPKN
jgi:hypothetical protein